MQTAIICQLLLVTLAAAKIGDSCTYDGIKGKCVTSSSCTSGKVLSSNVVVSTHVSDCHDRFRGHWILSRRPRQCEVLSVQSMHEYGRIEGTVPEHWIGL